LPNGAITTRKVPHSDRELARDGGQTAAPNPSTFTQIEQPIVACRLI
jgi:hypothetical protein